MDTHPSTLGYVFRNEKQQPITQKPWYRGRRFLVYINEHYKKKRGGEKTKNWSKKNSCTRSKEVERMKIRWIFSFLDDYSRPVTAIVILRALTSCSHKVIIHVIKNISTYAICVMRQLMEQPIILRRSIISVSTKWFCIHRSIWLYNQYDPRFCKSPHPKSHPTKSK